MLARRRYWPLAAVAAGGLGGLVRGEIEQLVLVVAALIAGVEHGQVVRLVERQLADSNVDAILQRA
jgi:hypothetical protein